MQNLLNVLETQNYFEKLFRNSKVHPDSNDANRFLKNTTSAVPFKFLSNFCISLEMP